MFPTYTVEALDSRLARSTGATLGGTFPRGGSGLSRFPARPLSARRMSRYGEAESDKLPVFPVNLLSDPRTDGSLDLDEVPSLILSLVCGSLGDLVVTCATSAVSGSRVALGERCLRERARSHEPRLPFPEPLPWPLAGECSRLPSSAAPVPCSAPPPRTLPGGNMHRQSSCRR